MTLSGAADAVSVAYPVGGVTGNIEAAFESQQDHQLFHKLVSFEDFFG
jgi:hypothetical protein